MAEQTTGATTPGATSDPQTLGQVPTNGSTAQAAENTLSTTTGKFSSDEAERIIADLRKEAAASRKRLQEFEAAQKAADDAKLSETERLQRQYADLQAQHSEYQTQAQQRIVRAEVKVAARDAGINPNLAARLVDYTAIEFDDDGEPKNLPKLLEALVKEYPELRSGTTGQPATNGQRQSAALNAGTTNPARSATTAVPALSWDYIKTLTAAEYAARRPEIQAWIMKNPPSRR